MTDTVPDRTPRAVIYVRSATESRGVVDQNAAIQARIAKASEIAMRHGLEVDHANIVVEAGVSGSSLNGRSAFLDVLSKAQAGAFTHVVVPDISRILRGGTLAEWKRVFDALDAGNVRLITG